MTAHSPLKCVLFVDDEASVLDGLRNTLRKMRREWDMVFVTSGHAALGVLQERPVDIVVSDMRMPEMDGVQLLNRVKTLCPKTTRFILSGHSDREMLLKSVGPTHQFLSKPCSPEALKTVLQRTFSLRELLVDEKLAAIVTDFASLPTIPASYEELLASIRCPDTGIREIARIIQKDVSISAKILQLVNSSFFGINRRVESVNQAVSLMGMDLISSLVLTTEVFEILPPDVVRIFNVGDLFEHSLAVGANAGTVAKHLLLERRLQDEAVLAGMMHDIGKVVLMTQQRDAYRDIYQCHRSGGGALNCLEKESLGVSHAEVGAYVLGLWGLSDDIVEAAAYHHDPSVSGQNAPSVLVAVHLANAFAHDAAGEKEHSCYAPIDEAYVGALGLAERLQELRAKTIGIS